MRLKAFLSALGLSLALSVAHARYAQQQEQQGQQRPQQAAQPIADTGYYTNAFGQTVHRPERTQNNAAPAGATAQCRDGTYSFSQHHRGTCSHHGGVATWL